MMTVKRRWSLLFIVLCVFASYQTGVSGDEPSSQPTSFPTTQPSRRPSRQPTAQPSRQPTQQPSRRPTAQPSQQPSLHPSSQPSARPTSQPSQQPSRRPTAQPSSHPSLHPSSQPSTRPTSQPSRQPSRRPTAQPSSHPSSQPSSQPSTRPTSQPSQQPSSRPTSQPTFEPTAQPFSSPSSQPSTQPTNHPTGQPTGRPSSLPTRQPTSKPSNQPSSTPTNQPSGQPSVYPSSQPTADPTMYPSQQPSSQPSAQPLSCPTSRPSLQPSSSPTAQPTNPTSAPTGQPSCQPSSLPSAQPSLSPSMYPSSQPTSSPSAIPSQQPTSSPTVVPSHQPTSCPSNRPSARPSCVPTTQPTSAPSQQPIAAPTSEPSSQPISSPTGVPSSQPSSRPSGQPSCRPSALPTSQPSMHPSGQPSSQPSCSPTCQPSSQPTNPTSQPTSQPTNPTSQPSTQPSAEPSGQPTCQPSARPSSIPTSVPSCGVGAEGDVTNCDPCQEGYYLADIDWHECLPCPKGSYAQGVHNAQCSTCSYPYSTRGDGQGSCATVFINMESYAQSFFYIGIAVSYFFCLVQAEDEFVPAFFRMLLPTVDVFSDIAYILTTEFYSVTIFNWACVFFLLSNILFVFLIVVDGYVVRAPWDFFRFGDIADGVIADAEDEEELNSAAVDSNNAHVADHQADGSSSESGALVVTDVVVTTEVTLGQSSAAATSETEEAAGAATTDEASPTADPTTKDVSLKPEISIWRSWTTAPNLRCFHTDETTWLPKIFGNSLASAEDFATMWLLQRLMVMLFAWVIAVTMQVLLVIYAAAFCLVYPIFLVVWFLLGCLLFQTKLFSIKKVRNYWLIVWMGFLPPERNKDFDLVVFALSMLSEFVLETIPQTMVQAYNNELFGQWSFLAKCSTAFSIIMVLGGVYFFGYHGIRSRETFSEISKRLQVFGDDDAISGNHDFAKLSNDDEWMVPFPPLTLPISESETSTDAEHVQVARQLWFVLTAGLQSVELAVEMYLQGIDGSRQLLGCSPEQLDAVVAKALALARNEGDSLEDDDWHEWKALLEQCERVQQKKSFLGLPSLFSVRCAFLNLTLRSQRYPARQKAEIESLVAEVRTIKANVSRTQFHFNDYDVAYFEQMERKYGDDRVRERRIDTLVMAEVCVPDVFLRVESLVLEVLREPIYLHPEFSKARFEELLRDCLLHLLRVREARNQREGWAEVCGLPIAAANP